MLLKLHLARAADCGAAEKDDNAAWLRSSPMAAQVAHSLRAHTQRYGYPVRRARARAGGAGGGGAERHARAKINGQGLGEDRPALGEDLLKQLV